MLMQDLYLQRVGVQNAPHIIFVSTKTKTEIVLLYCVYTLYKQSYINGHTLLNLKKRKYNDTNNNASIWFMNFTTLFGRTAMI